MSHAGRKAQGHQIGAHDHHGRNLWSSHGARRESRKCGCHENVDAERDQFSGQRRKPVVVAVGVAIFNVNILALNPTETAKRHEECVDLRISRWGQEKADPRDALALLSARRRGPGQCPASQSDECASFHATLDRCILRRRVRIFRHWSNQVNDQVESEGMMAEWCAQVCLRNHLAMLKQGPYQGACHDLTRRPPAPHRSGRAFA